MFNQNVAWRDIFMATLLTMQVRDGRAKKTIELSYEGKIASWEGISDQKGFEIAISDGEH